MIEAGKRQVSGESHRRPIDFGGRHHCEFQREAVQQALSERDVLWMLADVWAPHP